MPEINVLFVEDDLEFATFVRAYLAKHGFKVTTVPTGVEFFRRLDSHIYECAVIDLTLPDEDGIVLVRKLRARSAMPIIVLTAREGIDDKLACFQVGADDYLTKPFSVLELVARVRAIFRRIKAMQKAPQLEAESWTEISTGSLTINPGRREVLLGDKQIDLTAREFDLLAYFARNPGRVFRRADLLDKVWGYGHEGYEHTVNSHINRLRAKIETDPADPHYILTVWGVGYRFCEAAA